MTDSEIEKPRAWLIAAFCNGCKAHWRQRARVERVEAVSLADASEEWLADDSVLDRIETELLARRVLSLLSDRDRELLYLHYFKQLTAREIATALATTPRYAEKVIGRALRRARKLYKLLGCDAGVEGDPANVGRRLLP